MRRERLCLEISTDDADSIAASASSSHARVVRVAVKSPFACVKRLDGLPALRDRKLLDAVIRENACALFLLREPVVCGVRAMRDGSIHAAAVDGQVLRAIMSAFARPRFLLELIIPATAIPAGSTLETISRRTPFALRPNDGRGRIVARRLARCAAAIVFAVALAAALFAPAARATRDSSSNRRALVALERQVPREDGELRSASQLLDTRARFMAQRGATSRLFIELARALPDSVALTSLRIDSTEITFVATAPQVTAVLPELGAIPMTTTPRITSQVTRETIGGVKLERASFRLRRVRARKT